MPLLLKAVKRYLQGMTPHYKHIIAILTILFLTSIMTRTLACTCIGKNKQTTENELGFVDIAVTGKIISVSDYTYYDTAELALTNIRFDENKWSYMVRHYKRYQLAVDKKYKSASNLPDTIYIVTTQGSGDCGYMFDIGKEYIVYGEGWKEKSIATIQKKRKIKRKLTETKSVDTFYTDICRLTQEKNQKELDNLRRLTE
jgi:restriction endonuclease S subunit